MLGSTRAERLSVTLTLFAYAFVAFFALAGAVAKLDARVERKWAEAKEAS